MTLEEIKAAVDAGRPVFWQTRSYRVIRDSAGQYLIAYRHGESCAHYIGLTHQDGVTMNGREAQFFEPIAVPGLFA
jgi:hypothetical protein